MNGDDNTAKDILRDNLANDEFDADVFSKYFHTLIDLKELIEAEKLLDNYKAEIIQTYEYKLRRILLEAQGNYAEAILMIDKVIELGGKDNISIRSYLLLRDGQYQKAKNVCQNYLETVNFSQEASTETVNYELARKHLDLKPDNKRLDKLLTFDSSERTKAAMCALKDHKKDALDHIKNILRTDKTFRFEAKSWPVFNSIRQDPLFTSLIKHEKN